MYCAVCKFYMHAKFLPQFVIVLHTVRKPPPPVPVEETDVAASARDTAASSARPLQDCGWYWEDLSRYAKERGLSAHFCACSMYSSTLTCMHVQYQAFIQKFFVGRGIEL